MAKYSVVNTNRFTLQIGVGAGLFNQRLSYPYRADSGPNAGVYLTEQSFTDLEFPVSAEAYYMLGNRVGV